MIQPFQSAQDTLNDVYFSAKSALPEAGLTDRSPRGSRISFKNLSGGKNVLEVVMRLRIKNCGVGGS